MASKIIVQLDRKRPELNGGPPRQEHCTLDVNTWESISRRPQVLIRRDENRLALFTVVAANDASPGGVARVGEKGVERLGGSVKAGCLGSIVGATFAEFGATLEPDFLSDVDEATARRQTALIEQSAGTGTAIAVLAPHGGMIEQHTDTQVRRVYDLLVAGGKSARLWMSQGWKRSGDAYACWHITATELSPASFPKLRTVFETRFERALAFHGWSRSYIGVGGGADAAFRTRVRDAIAAVVPSGVSVQLEEDSLAGSAPKNIVNAVTRAGQGVQIEQPDGVRGTHATAIADAVAAVYLA
jgi:phage replication-related protein YjqB (UPF0714/DUF867 family)